MIDWVVFGAASAACVVGALGVIISRNPVHAALSLVGTLFGVAVLFVGQDADFLAAVQVIVYAGAIVVLFLFVIMLLGVDEAEDLDIEPLGGGQRLAAVAVGVTTTLLVVLLGVRASQVSSGIKSSGGALDESGNDIVQLGRSLFTDYVFAFELTSVLLVIAVVGAVVLARRTPTETPGQLMDIDSSYFLGLSAIIFSIGAAGLMIRRNPLVMFMCVELMLNAVNLTFVTFARELNDVSGQVIVFFVMVVAAAEVTVGLGVVVSILRRQPGATADDISELKG